MRSGGVLVAAGAATTLPSGKAFARSEDSEFLPATSVQRVSSRGVEVRGHDGVIATEGFPFKWNIDVGDRVALWSPSGDETHVRAVPLVSTHNRVIKPGSLRRGDFFGGDPALLLDPAALIRGDSRHSDQSIIATYWTVDREARSGPDRIIAVRW